MRLRNLALLMALLAVPFEVSAADAEQVPCDATADKVISFIEDENVEKLRSLFPDGFAFPPTYLPTIFRVIYREYGHPNETTRDNDVDLAAYTEQGIGGRGVEPPFRTYKYRTVFHRERDGVIGVKLGLLDEKCRIAELFFGIPRSRPDAIRRFYEIGTQIEAELAADAR